MRRKHLAITLTFAIFSALAVAGVQGINALSETDADVNGDGAVDVTDITSIVSTMAGDESDVNGDVNGDSTVDVADIAYEQYVMANSDMQEGNPNGVNVLNADNFYINAGETADLAISIDYDTEESVTAWGFSLYLPEGLELIFDEDGYKYLGEISTETNTRRLARTGLSVTRRDDGGYLVLGFDYRGNQPMVSTHGLLVTLSVRATAEVYSTGMIKGISLASMENVSLDLGNIADAEFKINGGEWSPDVNGDGTIDVADICSEYDKDWFGRYEGKIYQNMVDTPVASSEGGKEVLAVDTVLIEDGKGQISVRIDYETSEKIRGWNFSLYLPEGIVYKRASISNQTYSNYEYYGYLGLRTSAKPDGGYLFAWYDSMESGKMQLSSTKGILLTIDIEATEEFNGGMAEVRGIALSSYSCSSLELGNIADVKFEIKKATPETYIQAINNAIATNKHLNTELAAEAQVYVGKILDKGYDDTEEQTVMEQLKEYATRLAYTYLEIDVEEPGTLEELILAEVESLKDVQSLRVSGRVDSDELLQLQYEEYIRPEGMNLYELFADGTDMSEIGYISMTRLQRISLPETLTSMGRINSYSSLKQVTCYCMIPPYCYSNVVSRAGIELYVPKYSIDAYSQSAGWSNFNIHGMDTTPGDLKVYSSYTIDWLDSLTIDYKPNITLFSYDGRDYGKLTVDGSSTLSTDQLVMTCAPYQGRSAYAALLNNATMRADNISVELLLRANRWEFLTFPFDVKVSDIRLAQEGLPFAIRKYDGQKRADGLTAETWVDMTADSTLHAGQGYIWRFPAIYGSTNAFSIDAMQTVNKNNIFANSDIEVPLAYYESERGYNRSWNLIGNPYPCYYDTRAIQTTAPITVWDVNAQDYRAYSPLDDSYILTPGEAFFIQRPVDAESITLLKEGRQTDLSVRDVDYKPASARSYGNGGSRCVFNLTLSADGQSDHTRFVINPAASTDYEQAFDASKFQSLEKPAIQLYTIEGGLRYSINERPFANGTIALGMEIASSGIYTISLSTGAAQQVTLTDHLTGQEVRLDGNEDGYTFASEAGVFDSRFSISLGSGETTGISETDVTQPKSEYNVFDLQGRRVSNAKKGIYLIDGKKTVMK